MDRLAQTPRKNLQHSQHTGKGMTTDGRWRHWLLPIMAGFSLLWFLLTLFPAFERTNYHGLPLACSMLLLWVSGFGVLSSLRQLRRARFALSGVTLLLGMGMALLAIMSDPVGKAGAFTPTDLPNNPIGTGVGIHPGRVAWVRDPNAVQGDITWVNSASSGSGYYWDDTHNNQSDIDAMMGTTICWLSGQSTQAGAWDALFHSFNNTHGNGDVGYTSGQTVVIKVDLGNSINRSVPGVSDDNYFNNTLDTTGTNMPVMYDFYSTAANEPDVTPQAVISLLRQLIDQAGVPATDIYLYDSVRYWGYEYWRALYYPDIALGLPLPDESVLGAAQHHSHEFDGVHFVDCLGLQGREQAIPSTTLINYSNGQGISDTLPTVATQANYLINFATLDKGTGGIGCCNTNHFGSLCTSPTHVLPLAWDTSTTPPSVDPNSYSCFVDYIAHKNLGGNTFLYLLDGLWGGWGYTGQISMPQPWQMTPFSNDWPKSFFASQDPVAIDSVALDFFRTEDSTIIPNADDYLREAALADNPPSGTLYEPAGVPVLQSLGVHEVWNNATNKQYSRNLGAANGIELVSTPPSALSVLPVTMQRGKTGMVQIQLNAQGTECALGFSINFDPTKLSYSSAQLVGTAANATLNLNTTQLATGQLGVGIMASPTANQPLGTFASGVSQILWLTFTAIDQSAGTITTPISFGNTPIACDVVDVNADELPATYDAGTVTVRPPDASPTAINQSLSTNEGTALPLTLTGSDPNGYSLTFTVVGQPSSGSLSGTGANLTYTPNPGFYGGDSFTFTANDGVFTSIPATVSITVVRVYHQPIANSQTLSVNENDNAEQPTTLPITLSGTDQDGLSLTYSITSSPIHGTLTQLNPNSSANYQYTPYVGYSGADSFTFIANNGYFQSTPATVSITVLPNYQNPVAFKQTVTTPHGVPLTITLQGYDPNPNPNGKPLIYNIVSNPTHGTLDISNIAQAQVVYTPTPASFGGQDSFTFTVTDEYQLTSAPTTVAISVTSPNLQSVNLTAAPATTVSANTLVTLAAVSSGASNVQYSFQMNNSTLQAYSSSATCAWIPTQIGTYQFMVTARETGDQSSYTVSSALTITVVPALTAVNLSSTPASPQDINTPITLTATAQGGLNVLYTFTAEYRDASSTDHLTTLSYSSKSPTCVWLPNIATPYTLSVSAREANKATAVQSTPSPYIITTPVRTASLAVSPVSPAPINTPLTLTATATGGNNVEYHFLAIYQDATGVRQLELQAYSTKNVCQWTPTIAAKYQLLVSVRQLGDLVAYEAQAALNYQTFIPLTAISLTPPAGTPESTYNQITFTAAATGGTNVQYQFWLYTPNASPSWSQLQSYSPRATYLWTPTVAGNYLIAATARDSITGTEVSTSAWYLVSSSLLSQVTATMNPSEPAPANSPITITASATGGADVQYQFWVYTPNAVPAWTQLQAASPKATCVWTPTATGNYLLSITAIDGIVGTEVNTSLWYTVGTPLSAISATVNLTSPQAANKPITITATATGGINVQYQFWVYQPGASPAWSQLQAYSPTATCVWTPSTASSYLISVTARDGLSGATENTSLWYTIL